MNPRQHALLARQLIEACGTLDEAVQACRVSKSVLSGYQTPGAGAFMPADVIADLEAYCGEPVYSRALFEARPATSEAVCLVTECCEATESVSDLQREVRLAAADGLLTPRERDRLARLHATAEAQLRDVGAVIAGDAA